MEVQESHMSLLKGSYDAGFGTGKFAGDGQLTFAVVTEMVKRLKQ